MFLLKVIEKILLSLLLLFLFGCNEQEDCTADLHGEIVRIDSVQKAANTLAVLEKIEYVNMATIQSIRGNKLFETPENTTIYAEEKYRYDFTDFTISHDTFTNTLAMEIEGKTSHKQKDGAFFASTRFKGEMSVRYALSLEDLKITYKDFSQSDAKDLNKSAESERDGIFSLRSSALPCADGIYQLETLKPLLPDEEKGYTRGKVNINGTLFTFHEGGVADVSFVDGESAYGISSREASCE